MWKQEVKYSLCAATFDFFLISLGHWFDSGDSLAAKIGTIQLISITRNAGGIQMFKEEKKKDERPSKKSKSPNTQSKSPWEIRIQRCYWRRHDNVAPSRLKLDVIGLLHLWSLKKGLCWVEQGTVNQFLYIFKDL